MEILEKIFGEIEKIKIIKLFIFNPTAIFDVQDICEKTKVKSKQIKKDIVVLEKIGLIKRKDMKNVKGKKVKGFALDHTFDYLEVFKEFLLKVLPFNNEEIIKKLGRSGRLKAVAISGIFLNNDDSRVDLLVVGDRLKKTVLNNVIKEIEVGLGKEIKFTYLDSPDFVYRMEVRDKLIRDIFDYSHKIILDKIGIQP